MKKLLSIIILVLIASVIISCGKKGNPKPPEIMAPAPIKEFSVKTSVDAINLYWQAPTTDADDEELKNLDGFKVRRRNISTGRRGTTQLIAEIPLNADRASGYDYSDKEIAVGGKYEYVVTAVNTEGIEGRSQYGIRVTFNGEKSVIETF